uniref:Uncharacterized protein n=1 Tax=viral metagenome TaxID=1070528 RepID=A0A6C0JKS7_9ZZZZ
MFEFLKKFWKLLYSICRDIYYLFYELFHDGRAGGKRKLRRK